MEILQHKSTKARLPFDMDYLTDEIVQVAKKELRETDEVKKEALMEMRKLIREESKLVCPVDDNYLLQFLRARKFSIKRAGSLLLNYYHIKKTNADIYGTPNLIGFKQPIQDKIINVLPYRDYDGAVIMILQLYRWDVQEMKFSTFVHSLTCSLLACVDTHPATQICGIKIIVDTKGMGLNYVRYISPRLVHLIGRGLINTLPVRFKAIHCVNQVYLIQYFWQLGRLVLTEKIKNRIHFHSSNMESLHTYISPEVLPKEYGGTLDYDNRFWIKTIEEMEGRYLQFISYGYKSKKDHKERYVQNLTSQ